MPGTTSPWRVNDVVAYDRMRETAVTVFALLYAASQREAGDAELAREELVRLRRDVLAVDAYDRSAVAGLQKRLEARARELSVDA